MPNLGMDQQLGFSSIEFRQNARQTKREQFLKTMDKLIPWEDLTKALQQVQHRNKTGRRAIPLPIMLRLYFVQQWYNLSDEGLEDAVTDSRSLEQFVGIDPVNQRVPDATTMTRFRHRLEAHNGAQKIFETINENLKKQGFILNEGTVVDATIIAAPSSTKNASKKRDPEMHQTRKGGQWHFGMKSHIGVDRRSGLVHSVHSTAANKSDIDQTIRLLHGEEKSLHADAGYTGLQKRKDYQEHQKQRQIQGKEPLKARISRRKNKVKNQQEGQRKERLRAVEKAKASIRSLVEHPFHIIKNVFRYRKVRYRGINKNHHHQVSLYALANLVLSKRALKS